MEIAYKFTPKEIQKLSEYKNPFIIKKKRILSKMENIKYI